MSPGRCRSGGIVMRQAANRRSRSALNRPSRTSVSSSRDVDGHEPERQADGAVPRRDVGFAVAQQPREPALGGRRQLVDVVEEQRARRRPPGWRSRAPGPRGRGRSCRLEAAPNSCSSMSAGSAARLSMATIGARRRPRLLKALEQLLRAQSGLRQQQHRRAPGGGERERRPGTARRVRPADQWQRDLDRARRSRAAGGPPFSEWKMHASNRPGTASPRELHQGHFRAARAPTAGESGVGGENG